MPFHSNEATGLCVEPPKAMNQRQIFFSLSPVISGIGCSNGKLIKTGSGARLPREDVPGFQRIVGR